jgi:hypothetical protein
MTIQSLSSQPLTGLFAGVVPGTLQSWGTFGTIGLFATQETSSINQFAPPSETVKLVQVPTYGTMILRNTSAKAMLVLPMHVGFFQAGAQNHATSRVLVLAPDEVYQAEDCFCIQQSQGGYLQESQQRFMSLPLSLRVRALALQKENDFSRLWDDIDEYTRRFGVARGGHLERFLRPYFARLVVYRHIAEAQPNQIGAAYYVAGRLAGIEIVPNPQYWQDISPILAIYCYGPSVIQSIMQEWSYPQSSFDLGGITNLDELEQRLKTNRQSAINIHQQPLYELAGTSWEETIDVEMHGARIVTISSDEWHGQYVRYGEKIVYLSVFRDVNASHIPVGD